jgi:receptor expression-enhancing protein 1/2/3/4
MYWTTLSLFLLVESQLYFILYWVPFYSWIRFGIHLYLVLPGKQGSVFIYKEYIHPFLEEHERQIDRMISEGHAKAKAAGLDIVKQGIEYVRTQILGQAPKQPSPQPSRNVSYSTYLMDRFAMPSARQGLAVAGTSDVFNLIGKALQQTTYPDSTTREAKADDLAQSGTLIPPTLSPEERATFVSTQRERLTTLLQAFDREASYPVDEPDDYPPRTYTSARSAAPRQPSSRKSYLAPSDSTYMHKSRSESEFEDLAYEPMPDPENYRPRPEEQSPRGGRSAGAAGSGWSNWIWGSYGEADSAIDPRKNR